MSSYCTYKVDEFKGISRQDEVTLFKAYKETRSQTLRQEIMKTHAPFVIKVAKMLSKTYPHMDVDDLVGYGMMGMAHAIEVFDETLDIKFISFAVNWIRMFIQNECIKNGYIIRLPHNYHAEAHKSLKKGSNTIEKCNFTEAIDSVKTIASMDHQTGSEGDKTQKGCIADTIVYEDSLCAETRLNGVKALKKLVVTMKDMLSEKQYKIMCSYIDGTIENSYSPEKLAKIYNLKPERITLIINNVQKIIRNNIDKHEYV